jgi:hypothetical protein
MKLPANGQMVQYREQIGEPSIGSELSIQSRKLKRENTSWLHLKGLAQSHHGTSRPVSFGTVDIGTDLCWHGPRSQHFKSKGTDAVSHTYAKHDAFKGTNDAASLVV